MSDENEMHAVDILPSGTESIALVTTKKDLDECDNCVAMHERLATMARQMDQQAHAITALKREKASLQKLALAMAMGRCGFEPNAARTSATKIIVGDVVERLGKKIDEGTVLRHLHEAADEHLDVAG